jgi:hypothetical protein
MSVTERVMTLIAAERLQFQVYVILSLGVTLGTAILIYFNKDIYKPFFGRFNPIIVMLIVSFLGFFLLAFLLARGWFEIFNISNLQGWIVAAGLAGLFAVVMIFIDSRVILPPDVNRPFPDALLFYPTIGFVVEIIFHVLPLTLLLVLATSIFRNLSFENIIWPCIIIVALLEPLFQTWFGFSRPYPGWVLAIIAVNIFLINLAQLYLFKRYDFVTMYSMRLFYYLLWHIIWGILRLRILF